MITLYRESMDLPIGKHICICNNVSIIRLLRESDNEEEEINKIACAVGDTVQVESTNHITSIVCREMDAYFGGKLKRFSVPPVFIFGSSFAQNVWQEIAHVPYGHLLSYQQLAFRCNGREVGARAVGNAVGNNPIPILVPCHRIIRKSGEMGGFAWGTDVKRKLLQIEGVLFNEAKSKCLVKGYRETVRRRQPMVSFKGCDCLMESP